MLFSADVEREHVEVGNYTWAELPLKGIRISVIPHGLPYTIVSRQGEPWRRLCVARREGDNRLNGV